MKGVNCESTYKLSDEFRYKELLSKEWIDCLLSIKEIASFELQNLTKTCELFNDTRWQATMSRLEIECKQTLLNNEITIPSNKSWLISAGIPDISTLDFR